MALRPILSSEDHSKLPDALRGEYVLKDGSYVLDVVSEGGLELANVHGLKTALGKEKENLRKANERLAVFGDLDPVAAKEAAAKVAEMSTWTPEQRVKEQIETQTKALKNAFGVEKAALESSLGALRAQLEDTMGRSRLVEAIVAAEGSPELLAPAMAQRIRSRVDPTTNKVVIEVLDANGSPGIKDSQGTPMGMSDLVNEFKSNPVYAPAFKGSSAAGSGASGGAKGAPNSGPVRTISVSDQRGLSANLEDIAAGKITVTA